MTFLLDILLCFRLKISMANHEEKQNTELSNLNIRSTTHKIINARQKKNIAITHKPKLS